MNDFKVGQEVYWFEFQDGEKIYPLTIDDLVICSEKYHLMDKYYINNAIIGKSKNEAIDALIKHLESMKDE